MSEERKRHQAYWRANIRLMLMLLAIWALVSFGFGIVWVDALNQIEFYGFKLGFWFAQQGSIFTFVLLILIYIWRMNVLDHKFGVDEDDHDAAIHHDEGGH